MNSGWLCPKCGWVWAPHVQGCAKCNGPSVVNIPSVWPTRDPYPTQPAPPWVVTTTDVPRTT